MTGYRTELASLSHPGKVREANQDAFGDFRDELGRVCVVADGMGGHAGGQVASRVLVETFGECFQARDSDPVAFLRTAFETANERIRAVGQRDTSLAGLGTTGVAAYLSGPDRLWVAHVGDSRAYLTRAGETRRLTQDHSLVAELVRLGKITEQESEVHPRRNELMRSVGAEAAVEVEIAEHDLHPGDRLWLCSDGLWGVVTDAEMAARAAYQPPEDAVHSLVELANQRGGPDNITVQVLAIQAAEQASPGPEPSGQRAAPRSPRQRHLLWLAGAVLLVGLALTGSVLWLLRGGPETALSWAELWSRVAQGWSR